MNDSDMLTFEVAVRRAAPDGLPRMATSQAIDEFREAGRMVPRAVSDCIQRAGQLAGLRSNPQREPRVREGPATPEARRQSAQYLEQITPWVEQTRERLFGSRHPPFRSLRLAVAWIEAQARQQPHPGPRNRKKIRKLDRQIMALARELSHLTARHWSVRIEHDMLAYQRRGEKNVFNVGVSDSESPLGVLREAANTIHRATDFSEDAVVSHILTGASLRLPGVRYAVGRAAGRVPDGSWLVRGRATVTLHVRDVPYEDWHRLYRTIRKQWPDRKASYGLTETDERLLRRIKDAGGPPRQGAMAFWERISRQEHAPSGRAVMMRYRRASRKMKA